jgi:DNA-binding response OmpR family regulator
MSRILVVDDEPLIVEIIAETLTPEGHQIFKAYSGEEALYSLNQEPPDLILLDLMLPGMDGLEVSRQMQQDARLNHIPIIMLTAKTAVNDRKAGYRRGADDYITKPFDADELIIRVRSQLQHLRNKTEPGLTGLPGGQQIEAEIEARTADPDTEWAIIYADIENFRAYNQAYTFAQGDKLIQRAGACLLKALVEKGNPADFLGHIGGAEFVMLTTPVKSQPITERATLLFKQVIPAFFSKLDQSKGAFTSFNHQGELVKYPLVTLSFDIVDNSAD